MKEKIQAIKEYDFLIFGVLGLISGIVFLTTFKSQSDFFTREALAAESLILSIIFTSVLVNTLISSLFKKKEEKTEQTIEEREETYFSTPETQETKPFVPKNELSDFGKNATVTTVTAAAAYEWEIEDKAISSQIIPKEESKSLTNNIEISMSQAKEKIDDEDYPEEDDYEIDYAAGFVPVRDEKDSPYSS